MHPSILHIFLFEIDVGTLGGRSQVNCNIFTIIVKENSKTHLYQYVLCTLCCYFLQTYRMYSSILKKQSKTRLHTFFKSIRMKIGNVINIYTLH